MKYFLALTPPELLIQQLSDFHRLWGNAKNPPHITLKAPNSLAEPANWLPRVTELCQYTKPFEVTLDGVGQFGKAVLYMKAYAPELLVMHRHLLDISQPSIDEQVSYFEGEAFLPHLTLAHVESGLTEADIAHMALAAMRAWAQPIHFTARALGIYCSWQEGSGYHLQTEIPLAG
jgi:2'-5' RNA ligase